MHVAFTYIVWSNLFEGEDKKRIHDQIVEVLYWILRKYRFGKAYLSPKLLGIIYNFIHKELESERSQILGIFSFKLIRKWNITDQRLN